METVHLALTTSDGGVTIMCFVLDDGLGLKQEATPENIEAEIKRAQLDCVSWKFIAASEVPRDRTFRESWTFDGKQFGHDMDKARAIHMGRIRAARNAKLAQTDALVAALDGGPVPAELKAQRQTLRDIPQALDLSAARNVAQLKAIWPAELIDGGPARRYDQEGKTK